MIIIVSCLCITTWLKIAQRHETISIIGLVFHNLLTYTSLFPLWWSSTLSFSLSFSVSVSLSLSLSLSLFLSLSIYILINILINIYAYMHIYICVRLSECEFNGHNRNNLVNWNSTDKWTKSSFKILNTIYLSVCY